MVHGGTLAAIAATCVVLFPETQSNQTWKLKILEFSIKISAAVILGFSGSSLKSIYWLSPVGVACTEICEYILSLTHIVPPTRKKFATLLTLLFVAWAVLMLVFTNNTFVYAFVCLYFVVYGFVVYQWLQLKKIEDISPPKRMGFKFLF
tara:strand:+ start:490 stop:936 length:447 start_codon:yes stop_codon:yes gene_type:complete